MQIGLRVAAVAAAMAVVLTGCSKGDSGSGSLVDKAKNDKKLTIGIKYDQPGLGLKKPDGTFSGFDVDVATYVAKELGVEPSGITFVETKSAEREDKIEKGDVDFIAATYSITDKRKERVAFAGPYFVAHQDLLVKADDTTITGAESLLTGNKIVCSVTGSTSVQNMKDKKKLSGTLQTKEYKTYSDCVNALLNGAVNAVTTDDVILAGYAEQQPGKFKLIGQGFSDEKYGVGLKKTDTAGKDAVTAALKKYISSGQWEKDLKKNFGSSYTIPAPPTVA